MFSCEKKANLKGCVRLLNELLEVGVDEYVLTDYQGNTRVLFKDNGKGVAEEIESYSYYPNGALHGTKSDYASKYQFGGKELQTELDLDWLDFGTRCLDTWSGKWLGVDILAEAKPFMSPYSYGLGNPVRFSDPSGMIEEDQDGLMSVSTSLWGRDVTGEENTGNALTEKGWLGDSGRLNRESSNYTFNEHAGEEVSRNITGNGVDITYAGAFVGGSACCPNWAVNGAKAALSFMAIDTYTPDPTDGFWPKWAAYAMGAAAAGTVIASHTDAVGDEPISITNNSPLRIALGTHYHLADFAIKVNALPYGEWGKYMPTQVTQGAYAAAIIALANSDPNLTFHFNLTLENGGRIDKTFMDYPNKITTTEFKILSTAYKSRTTFYTRSGSIYKKEY